MPSPASPAFCRRTAFARGRTALASLAALVFVSARASATATPATDTVNGVAVEVLSRSTIEEGGRKITFVRIRPPVFPPRPVPAPVAPVEPSAEALAEDERLASKSFVSWMPSVTVHTRPPVVSEVRIRVGGEREITVWTNVDFRALRSVHQWESETTVYNWLPGFGEVENDDDTRPADLGLSPGPAEYVVEATAAELAGYEKEFAALDSILAYHDLNRDALKIEQARRAALEAEQKAERARQALLPPPKPKDETIYFWKNEHPTAH